MIDVQQFATESDWLAARGDTIGASEVPALFGEGYVSRDRLIEEKASGKRKPHTKKAKLRLGAGKLLEPVIGALLTVDGLPVVPCGFTVYRNAKFPGLHATPDFWVAGKSGVELVEAKSTGPDGLTAWGDWSGFGGRWVWSSEPPVRVWLQVQAQLAATGAAWGHVACLAGTEFHRWPVERDEDVIARIGAEVARAVEEINERRTLAKETTG